MVTLKTLKRGETFEFFAIITDAAGTPMVGVAEKFRCQIRTGAERLIAELGIEETDTLGEYHFSTDSTDTWPIGTLLVDIRITSNGKIKSSDTYQILVQKEVTTNV